jgi:hypothetical protein
MVTGRRSDDFDFDQPIDLGNLARSWAIDVKMTRN